MNGHYFGPDMSVLAGISVQRHLLLCIYIFYFMR